MVNLHYVTIDKWEMVVGKCASTSSGPECMIYCGGKKSKSIPLIPLNKRGFGVIKKLDAV